MKTITIYLESLLNTIKRKYSFKIYLLLVNKKEILLKKKVELTRLNNYTKLKENCSLLNKKHFEIKQL